jgi:predicted metalloprotease with PDZ domain
MPKKIKQTLPVEMTGTESNPKWAVSTSIRYKEDVYKRLKQDNEFSGTSYEMLVDQALRKYYGLKTPTIKKG